MAQLGRALASARRTVVLTGAGIRFEGALTACLDREPPASSASGFELSIAGDAEVLVPALLSEAA